MLPTLIRGSQGRSCQWLIFVNELWSDALQSERQGLEATRDQIFLPYMGRNALMSDFELRSGRKEAAREERLGEVQSSNPHVTHWGIYVIK